jgi:hypothetical protein
MRESCYVMNKLFIFWATMDLVTFYSGSSER